MVRAKECILGCLVVLAAVLTSLSTVSAASAANSFGSDMFGISAGGAIQGEDATTLARDLDAMEAVGSQWIRIDISWAQIQAGGPNSYNWSATDRLVQGATARGMKVLGVIEYTPSWARPPGTSATFGPDPVTYATFASQGCRALRADGRARLRDLERAQHLRVLDPEAEPRPLLPAAAGRISGDQERRPAGHRAAPAAPLRRPPTAPTTGPPTGSRRSTTTAPAATSTRSPTIPTASPRLRAIPRTGAPGI